MALQPVFIAGEWRTSQGPAGVLRTEDPSQKQPLAAIYPVSSRDDVLDAIAAGKQTSVAMRDISAGQRADFLETYADRIEATAEALVDMAHQETGLPTEPRLNSIELPRTADQIRQAAAAARDGSWRRATIDSKSNIRSILSPLEGAVVVFGPNNFPFAFNSAAGGDFAAAIAAGHPVIAKANTGHPGTTLLLAQLAIETLTELNLPLNMVQLLYRTPRDVGAMLVSHPDIAATGFTGSKSAGLSLKAAADAAGKPIYLEMSSVNPVFLLPGVLRERGAQLASEFFASCAMGAGQFCTNPGLIALVDDAAGRDFISEVRSLFEAGAPQTLLSPSGPGDLTEAIETLQVHGAEVLVGGMVAEGPGYAYANTLLAVSGDQFLTESAALQTEAFGTVSLLVKAKNTAQMVDIARSLDGNLTGCLYSHSGDVDDEVYNLVAPELRTMVGRLLNDKMPTGVAVVPTMNHGGPFPATGHPGFTAVGIPASLTRFSALQCYDEVRPHRLPVELRDANPTGSMWRQIDGDWTQTDVIV